MNPALLLIDLQEDFLSAAGLTPARGEVVRGAARLLRAFRARGAPVMHVRTTIDDPGDRMPHWKASGRNACVAGTPGHDAPAALSVAPGERIIDKTHFSSFQGPNLAAALHESQVDTVVLAGVHTHGCVRATALDAYEAGFRVLIAADAVASYDPQHAEMTRQYLDGRACRFMSADAINGRIEDRKIDVGTSDVDDAVAMARKALTASKPSKAWNHDRRTAWSDALADRIERAGDELADLIVDRTGKPVCDAQGEVRFAVDLVRRAGDWARRDEASDLEAGCRIDRAPLGVVAVITPWNNPLAIALGKIVPAIIYGNAVVWKPAPAGAGIADRAAPIVTTGLPDDLLRIVHGDHRSGEALAAHPGVDGVTITGSMQAGLALQLIAGRRFVPFQGELGGNNAAVVMPGADLDHAAKLIAHGAFGSAGQRCTANRRAIVHAECVDGFMEHVCEATRSMRVGDPHDPRTQVGPVISEAAGARIDDAITRARDDGLTVLTPHAADLDPTQLSEYGHFVVPAIIRADDPTHEIVRTETFGPVLVVQVARDLDHAIELCNGVPQGLASAIFTNCDEQWRTFMAGAASGLVKRNQSTAGADASAPFGGWGTSGIGPAEHGPADVEFYTRRRAVYESP